MQHRPALFLTIVLMGCYSPRGESTSFRGLGDDTSPTVVSAPRASTSYAAPAGVRTTPAPVQIGSGLWGSLGMVRNFGSDGAEYREEGDGRTVQLDAVNSREGWWVMTRLSFNPPLNNASWALDTVHTITPGSPSRLGTSVGVLSCSGPTRGRYTYDGAPSRMTVRIERGATPDARIVTFAQYWNNNDVMTGTFEYLPR